MESRMVLKNSFPLFGGGASKPTKLFPYVPRRIFNSHDLNLHLGFAYRETVECRWFKSFNFNWFLNSFVHNLMFAILISKNCFKFRNRTWTKSRPFESNCRGRLRDEINSFNTSSIWYRRIRCLNHIFNVVRIRIGIIFAGDTIYCNNLENRFLEFFFVNGK